MSGIISVEEARAILGEDAKSMTDDEIEFAIDTLDLMAKDALKLNKEEILRKRDAYRLAQLTYDIYRDREKAKE